MHVFEGMSHLSITVNLAIVSFTSSGSLFSDVSWDLTERLIFFIVAEHCVYLLMHFLSRFVPDISPAVTLQMDRAEYLVAKHIKGQYDKPEGVEELEAGISAALADLAGAPASLGIPAGRRRGGSSDGPGTQTQTPSAGPAVPPLAAGPPAPLAASQADTGAAKEPEPANTRAVELPPLRLGRPQEAGAAAEQMAHV